MSGQLINTHYYLLCVLVILLAFVIFFFSYERKKPQAREVVMIAVMSAISVVSRVAFIMLPSFKPMTGIIMITGMAFGKGAGFLTGAVSALVSNFIFGQGPWTPWQMFAYAVAGLLGGILRKQEILHESRRIMTAFFGFAVVLLVIGPILDTSSVLTMGSALSPEYVISVYVAGAVPNLVHAVATFFTLLILCKPMMEKLNRIKIKYGMLQEK